MKHLFISLICLTLSLNNAKGEDLNSRRSLKSFKHSKENKKNIESVTINFRDCTDLSFIKLYPNVQELSLKKCEAPIDIESLKNLKKLQKLLIYKYNSYELTRLSTVFSYIQELYIEEPYGFLNALHLFPSLKKLTITNPYEDFSIAPSKTVEILNIKSSSLEAFEFIQWSNLKELHLCQAKEKINTLNDLWKLGQLKSLYLRYNDIEDFSFLGKLILEKPSIDFRTENNDWDELCIKGEKPKYSSNDLKVISALEKLCKEKFFDNKNKEWNKIVENPYFYLSPGYVRGSGHHGWEVATGIMYRIPNTLFSHFGAAATVGGVHKTHYAELQLNFQSYLFTTLGGGWFKNNERNTEGGQVTFSMGLPVIPIFPYLRYQFENTGSTQKEFGFMVKIPILDKL